MAIANVQVRHFELQGLRMLLILVGKLVLFQSLNKSVDFFYVVLLSFSLPQSVWPAPGLDDTDLSESGSALELHRA